MINSRKTVAEYKAGILSENRAILAQSITLVESSLEADSLLSQNLIQEVLPFTGKSVRIGITGSPGVGKSTFIETFGNMLIQQGKKVAVLAVDPSSQRTRGSILGDKTRMEKLAADQRAFIRPSPSGSTLGGVSSKTREAMLLCEAAGFDVILIETVGVGQSETAVKGMVDFFLLLLQAGAGDELQGIKKGIMEMADGLLIHKADGSNLEEAKQAKKQYQNALHLFSASPSGWIPFVSIASSISGVGLEACWNQILEFEKSMIENGFFYQNRAQQRILWLEEQIQFTLETEFKNHPAVQKKLTERIQAVREGTLNPGSLARELTALYFQRS